MFGKIRVELEILQATKHHLPTNLLRFSLGPVSNSATEKHFREF